MARTSVALHCFTDIDCLNECLNYSQIELVQVTPGPLKYEFLSVNIGDLYLTRSHANQAIKACGDKHDHYINFVLLWVAEGHEFHAHGLRLCPESSLFGFDRQRPVEFISSPTGMITELFIPVQTFQAYTQQLQRDDLDEGWLGMNHVSLLPDRMQDIKLYLRDLFWVSRYRQNWLKQAHISQIIAEDLIPLLISQLPIGSALASPAKASRRAGLVARAEQKMMAHLDKPLTLKGLAQILGSSSSALSYGFQDLFGMSPMRYLKVRRLHAVRQQLKASHPEEQNVRTLAHQFGFWNAGHFARDYKIMFGELPSDTLQKTQPSKRIRKF